jgi:cytochrome c peroxidase
MRPSLPRRSFLAAFPRRGSVLVLALLWAMSGTSQAARACQDEEAPDPAEVAIGERLFLETRFAQFFAAHSPDDANAPLAAGDPALDTTQTLGAPLPGPFSGQSMNCRACHLVDEQAGVAGGGVRTYADFARRSPIPDRGDGHVTTLRNSPALVNAALPRSGKRFFLHDDGEFHDTRDLVFATLTGRNYGWLAGEQAQAVAHIASVVRGDDGSGDLAQDFGGSYAAVLSGKDPALPAELVLPKKFRINVAKATDKQLVKAVAKLIAAYVDQLRFSKDDADHYNASPYDLFLAANGLPAAPGKKESPEKYVEHLSAALDALQDPDFIDGSDGSFVLHDQPFVFGPTELEGLKIFLRSPQQAPGATSGVGNCAACHTPPDMTDFAFHNTGATQREYDGLHGAGAFALLQIPDLATRKKNFDAFLPPTQKHPAASGPFASVPDGSDPAKVDLGVWNVLFNPDVPRPQYRLRQLVTKMFGKGSPSTQLGKAVALFKTPSLRDLGQSGPYLHNALFDTLLDTVAFYADVSDLARAGTLRNGDPKLSGIFLDSQDEQALAAFLASLAEDYS